MTNASTRWMTMASLLVACAALNVACSSSSNNDNGDSGASGIGGKTGTGTGGSTTSGAGGGPPVVHMVQYTFDSTVQGWILSNYPDSPARNLAATYATDGGGADAQVFPDGGVVAMPTIGVDLLHGSPSPGSLQVTATFTDCNQYVDAIFNFPTALNLTGHTIHASLAVISGGFSGGAQLHLSTGPFTAYLKAPFAPLTTPGTYSAAALDLTTAVADTGTKDPTMVGQVGVQIFSGTACLPGMPYMNAGQLVTFSIDTVTD
jgi:hypothetical protein